MHFRADEIMVAKYRRHPTPYVFTVLKILVVSLPFYAIAFFVGRNLGDTFLLISLLVISLFVGFFLIYTFLIYFLDHLIVTNFRIIFVNWTSLFRREESEAELVDIQEIKTLEHGIISFFKFFDYGNLRLETASSKTTIIFDYAPNPEEIKHFILTYIRKRPKEV